MRDLGQIARHGLGRPGQIGVDVAGFAVGGALAALAAVRRGKAVHAQGVTYRARLRVTGTPHVPPEALLLNVPAERAAIVRFSRSLGVPRPLPDLFGLSIRVLDAYGDGRHQDFLLVTSFDLPVLNRILVFARDVQQRPYSSGLPYRAGRPSFRRRRAARGLLAAPGWGGRVRSPRARRGDRAH